MTPEADDADASVGPSSSSRPDGRRTSIPARRIVAVVLVAVVALVGLAWWALAVPYGVNVKGTTVDCDAQVRWTSDAEGRAAADEFARSCAEAESGRRRTALLLGAGVATVAAAVSTLPSRRLTGTRLGEPD